MLMNSVQKILNDKFGLEIALLITFFVCSYFLSVRFIKHFDKLIWFAVYFGFGTCFYSFYFSLGWIGSGDPFEGFIALFSLEWSNPFKIFFMLLLPTSWLSLIGGILLVFERSRKKILFRFLGVFFVVLGFFLTFMIFLLLVLDPSGL